MLKKTFITLVKNYSNDVSVIEKLWNEIEFNYSKKKRYYHNLSHLKNIVDELQKVKNEIKDWDIILFSVYYHDIIYSIYKKDNEMRSAVLAQKKLKSLSIEPNRVIQCYKQIESTKYHKVSNDMDTNYLIDTDLSILGMDEIRYSEYVAQVRKEYIIYPKMIYNKNRIKVLKTFLRKPKIYNTVYFFDRYEQQARKNMENEIKILKK